MKAYFEKLVRENFRNGVMCLCCRFQNSNHLQLTEIPGVLGGGALQEKGQRTRPERTVVELVETTVSEDLGARGRLSPPTINF